MRITDVKYHLLSLPIPDNLKKQGFPEYHFEILGSKVGFVEVYTDEGVKGFGPAGREPPFKADIEGWLKPLLVGENPLEVGRIWEKMYTSLHGGVRGGLMIRAISGIDVALWDIIGKVRRAPIYELLGGKHRDRLRAYYSVSPVPDLVDHVVKVVEEVGYTAVKIRVWKLEEVPLIKALRDALGRGVDLMVDSNYRCSETMAYKVARECDRHEYFWFEDPFMPHALEKTAKLAADVDVNITCGESLGTKYEFKPLITQGVADIIMADTDYCGGITEAVKIAALAQAYDMPCTLHMPTKFPFAGIQVSAALPNSLFGENTAVAIVTINKSGLVREPIVVRNGYIELPDKPGLGVEVNEDIAEKYRVKVY